jgi:hypothetical protein
LPGIAGEPGLPGLPGLIGIANQRIEILSEKNQNYFSISFLGPKGPPGEEGKKGIQ